MTTGRSIATRYGLDTICIVVFAGIALYSWWPADLLSNTTIAGGGTGDPVGQVSALAWTPFAFGHLINPLATNWSNYPVGVNLAGNAVAPLLGLLAWPITATAGPVAAANVIFPLGFLSAAISMYFVAKAFGISRFPSFVAGLLFGFSPYMVGQSLGHMAILWTCLMPIIALLLYRLLTNSSIRPRRDGVLLGLVCALQVYISDELLASVAVVTGITVALSLVVRPRAAWAQMRHAIVPLGYALGVFVALAGFMIWYQLCGPLHLTGPARSVAGLDGYSTDLLSPVVPNWLERVAPARIASFGGSFEGGDVLENGAYLGLPLFLVARYFGKRNRHDRFICIVAVFSLVAFVVSLGPYLILANRITVAPMPFILLRRLPLISSQVPSRYSLFMQLGVALLCAKFLDSLLTRSRAQTENRERVKFRSAAVLVAALVVIPLIPVFPIPLFPKGKQSIGVPSGIVSMDLARVPFGSVLLAYPYPGPIIDDQALLWQALAGYRYKIVGGYSIFRGHHGGGTIDPATLSPSGVQVWFSDALFGVPALFPNSSPVAHYPRTVAQAAAEIDQFVVRYHVATVAVDPVGRDPAKVIDALDLALGPVDKRGGAYVWYGAQQRARDHATR